MRKNFVAASVGDRCKSLISFEWNFGMELANRDSEEFGSGNLVAPLLIPQQYSTPKQFPNTQPTNPPDRFPEQTILHWPVGPNESFQLNICVMALRLHVVLCAS